MTKEELEKEADEYADTVKCEWENDTYWVDCRDEVTDAYLAGAEPREKRIADLEKKNAKLKTKVTALENANRAMVKELDDMTSGGVSVLKNIVRSKEQLTKAKEIIKNCLRLWNDVMTEENVKALIIEAEQFLKEVEK